jgi:hypothetical protein
LSGHHITRVQKWAIGYLVIEDANNLVRAEDRKYRNETYIHNPDLYNHLYAEPEMPPEVGSTDADEIDRILNAYFQDHQSMRASDVPEEDRGLEFGDWQ